MNTKLFFVFRAVTSIGLFGSGVYMAFNQIPNWGWILAAGIVCLPSEIIDKVDNKR